MPDRYGENAQHEAEQIAYCELCDDHGYRGHRVCDHYDHAAAARRGMDMIRQTMGWKRP